MQAVRPPRAAATAVLGITNAGFIVQQKYAYWSKVATMLRTQKSESRPVPTGGLFVKGEYLRSNKRRIRETRPWRIRGKYISTVEEAGSRIRTSPAEVADKNTVRSIALLLTELTPCIHRRKIPLTLQKSAVCNRTRMLVLVIEKTDDFIV